jgi:hypothetical protein
MSLIFCCWRARCLSNSFYALIAEADGIIAKMDSLIAGKLGASSVLMRFNNTSIFITNSLFSILIFIIVNPWLCVLFL